MTDKPETTPKIFDELSSFIDQADKAYRDVYSNVMADPKNMHYSSFTAGYRLALQRFAKTESLPKTSTTNGVIEAAEKYRNDDLDLNPSGYHVSRDCNDHATYDAFIAGAEYVIVNIPTKADKLTTGSAQQHSVKSLPEVDFTFSENEFEYEEMVRCFIPADLPKIPTPKGERELVKRIQMLESYVKGLEGKPPKDSDMFHCPACGEMATVKGAQYHLDAEKRIAELEAQLTIVAHALQTTRGQWFDSVNKDICLAALDKIKPKAEET